MEPARKTRRDTQRTEPAVERAPVRTSTAGSGAIAEAIELSPRQSAQRQQITAIARSPRVTAQRQAIEALSRPIPLSHPSAGAVVQRQIGKSKDGEQIIRLADDKVFIARLIPRPSAAGTHTYRLTAADETVDNVSETDAAYDSLNGAPAYGAPAPHQPVAVPLPAVLYHATPGRLNGNMPAARSWFTPNFEDAVDYSNRTANVSVIYRYTVTQRLVTGLLLLQQRTQFTLPAHTLLAQQGLASAHGWLEDAGGIQSVFLKNPANYLAFTGVCGYTQPSIFSVPLGTPVVSTWTDWHNSTNTLLTGTGAPFPINAGGGHMGRYDRNLAGAI